MIWTLGAFTEWIRDGDRFSLEFRASDMLFVSACVLVPMVIWNFFI